MTEVARKTQYLDPPVHHGSHLEYAQRSISTTIVYENHFPIQIAQSLVKSLEHDGQRQRFVEYRDYHGK